jgi:hypothetical protein
MSDSVRLKSQSVSTIAPRKRRRAASTSSSVTGTVAEPFSAELVLAVMALSRAIGAI